MTVLSAFHNKRSAGERITRMVNISEWSQLQIENISSGLQPKNAKTTINIRTRVHSSSFLPHSRWLFALVSGMIADKIPPKKSYSPRPPFLSPSSIYQPLESSWSNTEPYQGMVWYGDWKRAWETCGTVQKANDGPSPKCVFGARVRRHSPWQHANNLPLLSNK